MKPIKKIKNFFHLIEAVLANFFYGYPSKKLKVIGVTGTDGKTTTTHLIYHILKTAGRKVSMISTVYAKIGNKEYDTGLHTTTPSSFLIQKLLNQSVKNKDEYFVLEVTSHGLDQNRVWGIDFDIGVLTNITHEHLDYHGNYQDYLKTKCLLLKRSDYIVLNEEDNSYKLVLREIKNQKSKIKNYNSKLKILKNFNLTDFNRSNYAAAFQVAKILNITDEIIKKSFTSFKLPKGRLELVYDNNFKVIIDFAHTPNAFKQVLPEIKKRYLKKDGRLIHIFGAAGLRDSLKRPLMGEISGCYADKVILTEEDYRTENPFKICQQITQGLEKKGFKYLDINNFFEQNSKKIYTIIINRFEAIKKAIINAKENDVILLTGKGHEKSLSRGKSEYSWDEFLAVKEILAKYLKK
ncbi:MAG: Mur ligase family protein [Patescibacteria group bacterium]|nr:Mur ligase family protein [Patescibacteria group bacterium]